MKIQVLFGSQSDERVYGPLCRSLEGVASEVKMEVASAHRDPARVREIMTTSPADIFVAGAGLAAHLPGVVASLTSKPVVGIAVDGAFGGLDAFMSIAQMPKGIPVMAVNETQVSALPALLQKVQGWKGSELCIHWDKESEQDSRIQNALEQITELRMEKPTWVPAEDPRCRGQLVLEGRPTECKGLGLWLADKARLQDPSLALSFFAQSQRGGFWVGVNNFKNFLLQIQKLEAL